MRRTKRSASRATVRSYRGHRRNPFQYLEFALEEIFSNANIGIALIDQDKCYVRVNDAFARAIGSDPQSLMRKKLSDSQPTQALNSVIQNALKYGVTGQGETWPFNIQGQPENDTTAWSWNVFPVRKSRIEPAFAAVTLEKVERRTDRYPNPQAAVLPDKEIGDSRGQEKELELMEQTRLIRLIQDVAIAANEAVSATSALQYAIDRICQHLNWPVGHALLAVEDESLVSARIWSKNLSERYQGFRNASDALNHKTGLGLPGIVMKTGQPAWFNRLSENPKFRRNEEARKVGLKTGLAFPIQAGSDVVGVLEFFTEEELPPDTDLMAVLPHIAAQVGRVIERERTQQALRKSEAKLRTIMTNLPVVLWVIDVDGRLTILEGKGLAATGIDGKDWLGRSIFDLLSEQPDAVRLLRRTLGGEDIHIELATPDGKTYETYYSPIWNTTGEVEGAIRLSFDITERKNMEEQLDELRRRLMESVDAERARLAQQLHDGPLQDLYGAFYQIQEIKNKLDGPESEVTEQALETIQQVNATLRVICGELRPTTLVHLGLQKAIRSHTELLQDRQENILIHLDLVEDVIKGTQIIPHAVRLGLFRVYQQLINNAIRHAEARHIWVRLRLFPNEVILEVKDDGKGFMLPDNWIEMVRKGQFGLNMIQERVQGMNGSVKVESSPEHGSLIQVTVPLS